MIARAIKVSKIVLIVDDKEVFIPLDFAMISQTRGEFVSSELNDREYVFKGEIQITTNNYKSCKEIENLIYGK